MVTGNRDWGAVSSTLMCHNLVLIEPVVTLRLLVPGSIEVALVTIEVHLTMVRM